MSQREIPEPKIRNIDGRACSYFELGRGDPIVFLHGFPDTGARWIPVMHALASEHRTIAPDLPGFGRSDAIPSLQVLVLADWILTLIAQASEQPVWLVGHDWGGLVAWYIASRFPSRVRGVMIVNGPHPEVYTDLLRSDPEQARAARYVTKLCAPNAADLCAADNFAFLRYGLFDLPASILGLASYRQHLLEVWTRPGVLTSMTSIYRDNLGEGRTLPPTGAPLARPCAVMWGIKDHALVEKNLAGIRGFCPDAEIREVPAGSHWVDLTHRALFLEALATMRRRETRR